MTILANATSTKLSTAGVICLAVILPSSALIISGVAGIIVWQRKKRPKIVLKDEDSAKK